MEPLKEMFNAAYYAKLAKELANVYPKLDTKKFKQLALQDLESKELNDRLRHTSRVVHACLPQDFPTALVLLEKLAERMPRGYTALVYPDFVAQFGLAHPDLSLPALAYFTTFGSSEFAIRPFLKQDFKSTIKVMQTWSKHSNEHLRRLSSEGSRPRLPWSFKLDAVIKDPSLTFPILNQLKTDESLYVRKSVANHLNDVSKDQPDFLIRSLKIWDQSHLHTAWITKQAVRTLIKKGHPAALSVLEFEASPKLSLHNFKCPKKIALGERLEFSFELLSEKKSEQKLVVDYIIHYVKKSGEGSAKVFKLKNITLKPSERLLIKGSRMMQDYSTRKHFAGKHILEIQVNGKVMASATFNLSV